MNPAQQHAFQIPYTSQDFPHGVVKDAGTLTTDWHELLWATLTVGRPNTAYVFAHGEASYHEALFRLSLVRMALEKRPFIQSLLRTDAFQSLDPTEKGAVSYFLGMAVCRLFAYRLLDITWLLHLDVFRSQLKPEVLGKRSRPDLVGMDDSGAWHSFECKGRSSVPSTDDRQKAKAQAQRLVRVDSANCSLHVGAISFFRRDTLQFHWRDPDPGHAQELEPLEVDLPHAAWRHYYAHALALDNASQTEQIPDSRLTADVQLDIHDEIRGALSDRDWAGARLRAFERRDAFQREGFRPDGLKVIAGPSWPQKRETVELDM